MLIRKLGDTCFDGNAKTRKSDYFRGNDLVGWDEHNGIFSATRKWYMELVNYHGNATDYRLPRTYCGIFSPRVKGATAALHFMQLTSCSSSCGLINSMALKRSRQRDLTTTIEAPRFDHLVADASHLTFLLELLPLSARPTLRRVKMAERT